MFVTWIGLEEVLSFQDEVNVITVVGFDLAGIVLVGCWGGGGSFGHG